MEQKISGRFIPGEPLEFTHPDLLPEMEEVLEAATRALESIERNQDIIISHLRHTDGGLAGATHATFEGWKRSLNKARALLAKLRG